MRGARRSLIWLLNQPVSMRGVSPHFVRLSEEVAACARPEARRLSLGSATPFSAISLIFDLTVPQPLPHFVHFGGVTLITCEDVTLTTVTAQQPKRSKYSATGFSVRLDETVAFRFRA